MGRSAAETAPGGGTAHPHAVAVLAGLGDTVVIADVLRAAFAEMPQVIDELHAIVSSDDAVQRILCPARTGRTDKSPVLVEHIVHTHADFAPLTAEYLLAQIEVAEQEFVVVIVGKSDVLRVGGCLLYTSRCV